MCQVHKIILKKYTVTFQIIKNTLKISLCYVPSTQTYIKNTMFLLYFYDKYLKNTNKI